MEFEMKDSEYVVFTHVFWDSSDPRADEDGRVELRAIIDKHNPKLKYTNGGPTDEGYHLEEYTYWVEEDEGAYYLYLYHYYDGQDCDGRLDGSWKKRTKLTKAEVKDMLVVEDDTASEDIGKPSYRDYQAEAAGY